MKVDTLQGKGYKPVKVINAKEASELWVAMENTLDESGNVGWLTESRIQEIIGQEWQLKLGALRLKDEEKAHKKDKSGLIALDAYTLAIIAASPVEPDELTLIIRNRFGSAPRALSFLEERPKHPTQPQEVLISVETMERMLGMLWEERLKSADIHISFDKKDSTPQAHIPIAEINQFCGARMAFFASEEAKNPTSNRHFGPKGY